MSNKVINDIENDAEQIDKIVQQELVDIGINSANFNGHKLLKKSGEKIPYTQKHIEEYKKCAENPIYFAENYVYIVNIERGREKIKLYPYQKEMIENFAENRYNITLSSRQSGKTTVTSSFLLWYILFHSDKSIGILANKARTAQMIVNRMQLSYTLLPKWLQQGVTDWNKQSFTLENGSRVLSAATSSDSIRGESLNCVTGDTKVTILDENWCIYSTSIEALSEYIKNKNISLKVLTAKGYKSFYGVKVSYNNKKIKLIFNDSSELKCTYDHLLQLANGEFKTAEELNEEDILWNNIQLVDKVFYEDDKPVYDLVNVEETSAYITNNVVSHNCLYIDECVTGNSKIRIKHKVTNEIKEITMEDMWELCPEGDCINKRFTNYYTVFSNDANDFVPFDGIKRTRNKTILLQFNDGTEIESSWTHKILLKNKGLREAQSIQIDDETTTGKIVIRKEFLFEDKYLYDLLNTGKKHLYNINGIENTNCAFIPESVFTEFWRSVYPTISSSKTSKIILVSTPNGPNFFHTIWKKAQEGTNGYVPFQVNWWDVPGRDEKWKEEQIAATDEETFNQEFGCDFNTNTLTLISSDRINYIETMALKPVNFNRTMKIYKNPQKNHTYVLSCDVADQGIDFSVVSVIDITEYPWEQVCVYRENISYIMFPPVIMHIASMYNNGYVLVENNDVGKTILHVLNYEYELENIISTQVASGRGRPVTRYELGQRTTTKTKSLGCTQFRQLVNSNKIRINNDWTIEEIKHFCVDSKGSYSSDSNEVHDDCVMTLVNFSYFSTTPTYKLLFDKDVGEDIRAEEERMIEESLLPLPMESRNINDSEWTADEIKWVNE